MKKLINIFNNKVILVTGGTGSFGNAFVEKTLKISKPKKLIVFSRDELKQFEMSKKYSSPNLRFFLGDVRDYNRLLQAFRGVDIVVHAAALKQVNTAEYNPEEFVKTNVNGAQNVINAAIQTNVAKVIALSTDKASNPINLYGVTKLCSDKLFVAANSLSGLNGTKFSIARYGNVSGSRGSVLPFFKNLLNNKSSFLPITDKRMTRFWISLDTAYNFVCMCLNNMNGGEIFIPKLPSIKILDLANALNKDIKKKIIGVQPGEKLHETMFTEMDAPNIIEFKDYFTIVPNISFFKKKNNFYINKNGEKGKKINKERSYSSKDNIFLQERELKEFIS